MTRSPPQNPIDRHADSSLSLYHAPRSALRQDGAADFSIDRSDPATCHTPRRNTEVDTVLRQSEQLRSFCNAVVSVVSGAYRDGFSSLLPPGAESPSFSVINDNVFVPVAIMLALEEKPAAESSGGSGGGGGGGAAASASPASLFSPEDFETIMGQQQQEMQAKFEQMNKVLPIEGIVTTAEAALVSGCALCIVGASASGAMRVGQELLVLVGVV
jgi:hypothetical protein